MASFEFSNNWHARAVVPMVAAMQARHPYKSVHAVKAEKALRDCARAYSDYESGAAAALLDVISFLHQYGLPMPQEVAEDSTLYARLAMSGRGIQGGKKKPAPLSAHRFALIKRIRFEYVRDVLGEAQSQEHQLSGGLPGLCQSQIDDLAGEWEQASKVIKHAVTLAVPRMPEVASAKRVTEEAVYRDYREVADLYDAPGSWPGQFYLPTEATCRLLEGWSEFPQIFLDLSVTSDAPRVATY